MNDKEFDNIEDENEYDNDYYDQYEDENYYYKSSIKDKLKVKTRDIINFIAKIKHKYNFKIINKDNYIDLKNKEKIYDNLINYISSTIKISMKEKIIRAGSNNTIIGRLPISKDISINCDLKKVYEILGIMIKADNNTYNIKKEN